MEDFLRRNWQNRGTNWSADDNEDNVERVSLADKDELYDSG